MTTTKPMTVTVKNKEKNKQSVVTELQDTNTINLNFDVKDNKSESEISMPSMRIKHL